MATIAPSRVAGNPTQPATAAGGTHPFTCVTCAVAFRSSELQRAHMRTDWHRYNLQRKVASLPPLPAETFTEKVQSAQASKRAAAAKATFARTCQACEKTYYSENAYNNHLSSQKHKARAVALETGPKTETDSIMSSAISLGEPIEIIAPENTDDLGVKEEFSKVVDSLNETTITSPLRRPSLPLHDGIDKRLGTADAMKRTETKSQASESMPVYRCVFCNYDSTSLKANVVHMAKLHGMFIPERDYIADVEGLISYLQAKASKNFECLFCHKIKYSLEAIQTHMRDKGHCMIGFETDDEKLEIGQFYDFRSSYSDAGESDWESESDDDAGTTPSNTLSAKLDARRDRKNDATAESSDEADEAWETDSDTESDILSSLPPDEIRRHIKRHRQALDKSFHAYGKQTAYEYDNELYLPSGRIAGHRSLNVYFRQNPRSYLTQVEKKERKQIGKGESTPGSDAPTHFGRFTLSPVARNTWQALRKNDSGIVLKGLNLYTPPVHKQKRIRYWNSVAKANNKQKYFRDDNFGIRR